MALDCVFTTGVIAVKEKNLLKEKLFRLAEMTAEEAFRALIEHGFGGGAETASTPYEYENLIAVEEKRLEAFIREYAPKETAAAYFLASRDFHNAKALLKAKYLGVSEEKMLAGEGLIPVSVLSSCVASSDFSALQEDNPELKTACEETLKCFEEETVSGAEIGVLFDRENMLYLTRVVKYNRLLKNFLAQKADMLNILTAFRAANQDLAEKYYLPCGTLSKAQLSALFLENEEKLLGAFLGAPYAEFDKVCLQARGKGLPFTDAEKRLASFETEYFAARKYELKREEPFLYYVLRRRVENANVRIVFAGKLAGLREAEIKNRLRTL